MSFKTQHLIMFPLTMFPWMKLVNLCLTTQEQNKPLNGFLTYSMQ